MLHSLITTNYNLTVFNATLWLVVIGTFWSYCLVLVYSKAFTFSIGIVLSALDLVNHKVT